MDDPCKTFNYSSVFHSVQRFGGHSASQNNLIFDPGPDDSFDHSKIALHIVSEMTEPRMANKLRKKKKKKKEMFMRT